MSDLNDKLAALQQRLLERDDESDPGGRIYRDKVSGEIYHSVTRILGATAPEEQKKPWKSWLEMPGLNPNSRHGRSPRHRSPQLSRICPQNLHNDWHVEQLKNATAGNVGEDGLYRAPKAVTKWSPGEGSPRCTKCPWSASGFARGLRGWILDNVTAIHSVEFSAFHPAGFAGAC